MDHFDPEKLLKKKQEIINTLEIKLADAMSQLEKEKKWKEVMEQTNVQLLHEN